MSRKEEGVDSAKAASALNIKCQPVLSNRIFRHLRFARFGCPKILTKKHLLSKVKYKQVIALIDDVNRYFLKVVHSSFYSRSRAFNETIFLFGG